MNTSNKVLFLVIMLTCVLSASILSESIQATTTSDGRVRLYEDGSWEWIIQPGEYAGFHNPENEATPMNEETNVETVPFNFDQFSNFPIDYVGKWTWIMGEVYDIIQETTGEAIRIKSRKDKDSWLDERGDVFVIGYPDEDLEIGDKIQMLVKFKGLGYKFYSNVPAFQYTDKSKIRFLE